MVVCSRKLETYSYSKITKALHVAQIKLILIYGKVVGYVGNGYPRGGKSYDLLKVEPGGSKFINHICITFNVCLEKKSKDLRMKLLEIMTKKTRFEVKFPTMDISCSKGTIIKAYDCHLTHDKASNKILPSPRDNYVDFLYYALNVVELLQN